VTEQEDNIQLRNIGNHSSKDTTSHLRGLESSGEIIFWGHVRCCVPRDGSDSVLCAMDILCHCYVPRALCAIVMWQCRAMNILCHCYVPCTLYVIAMCHGHSVPMLCAMDIQCHCDWCSG
jgi:hypothetical protein